MNGALANWCRLQSAGTEEDAKSCPFSMMLEHEGYDIKLGSTTKPLILMKTRSGLITRLSTLGRAAFIEVGEIKGWDFQNNPKRF